MTYTLPSAQTGAVPTSTDEQQKQEASESSQLDSNVTPEPVAQNEIAREQKIEYRDADGNLLDEEQVSSLAEEGQVTFKTTYETRTRRVDANGNEVEEPEQHAPQHPDAEGQNPDTSGNAEARSQPASAAGKGLSKGNDDAGKPKPASDANEATK